MTNQTEISNTVPFSPFPEDKKEDMQVKINDITQDTKGNCVAYNMNTPECYEKGEVISIPQNDFNFYMSVFEKFEKCKEKRAECQRNYYLNNKSEYYQRQKKWRDGKKLELNKRRREKYALAKLNNLGIADDAVAVPVVSVAEQEQEQEQQQDEKVLLTAKV
tara:strand:- start:289 stop:774 length:486 start_codon:yes stop_codon:yes gene_type:complete